VVTKWGNRRGIDLFVGLQRKLPAPSDARPPTATDFKSSRAIGVFRLPIADNNITSREKPHAKSSAPKNPNFIIGELGPGMPVNRKALNLDPRLSIVDGQGKCIARLGGENGSGIETGKFLAPHGIALESKGDIYVGEVGVTDWKTSFPDTPLLPEVAVTRCLQELERVRRTGPAVSSRLSPRLIAGRLVPLTTILREMPCNAGSQPFWPRMWLVTAA
jgi:hypothetical protein